MTWDNHPVRPTACDWPIRFNIKSIVSLLTCLVLHRLCSWWMWCASRMCVLLNHRYETIRVWNPAVISILHMMNSSWGVSIITRTWMMILAIGHAFSSSEEKTYCEPWICFVGGEMGQIGAIWIQFAFLVVYFTHFAVIHVFDQSLIVRVVFIVTGHHCLRNINSEWYSQLFKTATFIIHLW